MSETDAQLRKALLALVPRDGADWQDVLARATPQSIPRCRVAATQAITAKRTPSGRRLVRNGALVVLSAAVAAAINLSRRPLRRKPRRSGGGCGGH